MLQLQQRRMRQAHTTALAAVVVALLLFACMVECVGSLKIVNGPVLSTSTAKRGSSLGWSRSTWLCPTSSGRSGNGRTVIGRTQERDQGRRTDGRGGGGCASRSTASMGITYNPNDELRAIVQRKQHEVKSLLAAHGAKDDPLQMRLSYGASESCYALRGALRRNKGREQDQLAVVVADMKRRSPTSAELSPDINAFDDPAAWASQLHTAGAEVLMVNTDGPAWGGSMSDLDAVVAHFKKLGQAPPPIIMKDMIVHPIQMAQALEKGAAGTVLIACVLGPALCDFMDTATVMGTECIVEVHTPAEVEKALELGANVIMVNNWDRITGRLHPKQAMAVRNMIPDQVLTIACGGINSLEQAGRLTDEGYDAIVLGRSLVAGGAGLQGAAGGATGPELIQGIVDRIGVPRSMLGWGISPEDLEYEDVR